MPKPYSYDLRIRVARAAAKNIPIREVAAHYDVSPSFVSRMHQLLRETGDVLHKQFGGYKRHKLAPYANHITKKIENNPSITLAEIQDWLHKDHGLHIHISTLDRFIRLRLNMSYKKNGSCRRA